MTACVWEGGARCFVCGSFGTLQWYPRLERFCWTKDFNIIFQEKYKRFGTSYVIIAVNRYFPDARKKQLGRVMARGCEICENKVCQGTQWSEELDGKTLWSEKLDSEELHGARSLVESTI